MVSKNLKLIKFKMGSVTSSLTFYKEIQFEEQDQSTVGQKSTRSQQMLEYLAKTFPFQYLSFSRKRQALFSTLKVLFALDCDEADSQESDPFYLLAFVSCSELCLKNHLLAPTQSTSPQAEMVFQNWRYRSDQQLKVLNYNDFDDTLLEFDRYVKDVKRRAFSSVFSFMKANRLSSLVHSKPAEETAFRFMDVRVRVYFYGLMERFVGKLRGTDAFFRQLNDAGLGNRTEAKGFGNTVNTMQNHMSKVQRSMQVAVHDLLLKNDWSDRNLLAVEQAHRLEEWITAVRGCLPQPALPKTYNTALYNRLLTMSSEYGNYLQENNKILNALLSLGSPALKLLPQSLIFEKTLGFDKELKTIISRKTKNVLQFWNQEFFKAGSSASDSQQACNRQLLSLKLTLKYCQMIRMAQEYHEMQQYEQEIQDSENQNQADVHFLGRIPNPSSPSKKETGGREKSRKYFQYFMSKIMLNHMLKSAKFREMQEVLLKFKESVKKDQEVIMKNYEYDHLIAENVNFCQMASTMSSQKRFTIAKKSAPELTIDKETIESYLGKAIESSFIFPNHELLETNLTCLLTELAKCSMKEQTRVYRIASLQIASQKRKRIEPKPRLKDNLVNNMMANNGRLI